RQEKQVTLQLVVPISITIAALLSGINRAPRYSENAIQYQGDNRHQTNGDDIAVEDFQQPEAERVTAIKETGNLAAGAFGKFEVNVFRHAGNKRCDFSRNPQVGNNHRDRRQNGAENIATAG